MGVELVAVGALIALLGGGVAVLFQVQIMLYKANDRVLDFHPGERLRARIRRGGDVEPLALGNPIVHWIIRYDNKSALEKWRQLRNLSLVLVLVGILAAVIGMVLYNL